MFETSEDELERDAPTKLLSDEADMSASREMPDTGEPEEGGGRGWDESNEGSTSDGL